MEKAPQTPTLRWIKRGSLVVALLALPYVVHQIYYSLTDLPDSVRIATGTAGGRYREVAEALGHEMAARGQINVEFIETRGSIENLEKLEKGGVHLALFQPEAVSHDAPEHSAIRSVANVFSETVLILVRRDAKIESLFDFRGFRVSLGPEESGDRATARMLLAQAGFTEQDLYAYPYDYSQVLKGFRDGSLEAAIVTVGLEADFLKTLASEELVRIIDVPFVRAIAARHLETETVELPAGIISTAPTPLPRRTVNTISVRSHLVTTNDVPNSVVELAEKIILDQRFQRKNRLAELFEDGSNFARERVLFPLHDGALHILDPELKPLLSPDFVEATEGLRSFVVSTLVAVWLIIRWLKQNQIRKQEHRLDRFIVQLLEIERQQMDLDQTPGHGDTEPLNNLLDDVTKLRQEALGTLTAHELHEDPAAAAFIGMCHALSNKINAKLSRQRLDAQIREVIGVLRASPVADDPGKPEVVNTAEESTPESH